jgi:choline dehydrogenase-like flavoprotein
VTPATQSLRADAVVVGTGAGGGPAAAALAEAGLEVALLEAGPHLQSADFRDDEWSMRTRLGRIQSTGDATQSFYAGTCVGGSTVVNDALCWRPPPEVLAGWRQEYALAELSDEHFAAYVERAWSDVHAEPTRRSHVNKNADALARGAQALGWANEAMPRNVQGCARLGRCNLGCPTNAKQSTLVTYVPRAERAGARLFANVRVRRVRVRSGRAEGVEALRIDSTSGQVVGEISIDAPLVLLAAGALGTPAVLLRSGIAAGGGFQAHSSVYVSARFAEAIHGYFGPTMAWAVSEFADVNGRSGPGFMLENAAVRPLQTASTLPDFGVDHERAMAALPHLASTVVVLRDRSRGHIGLDERGHSRVDYTLDGPDLERLGQALRRSAELYLAAGAEEAWLPVHGVGPVRSKRDLERLPEALDPTRLSLLYAVHLFGGAGMGGSREQSVCRPDGRVWDVQGLYVCDASSLPSNTGVNPQITILANALRIADGAAS